MKYLVGEISDNQQITDDIWVLRVTCGTVEAKAGQFYMLKSWDTEQTLMRPISVFKAEEGCRWFMYRVVGLGTRRMSLLEAGDQIRLLGPCGNGYPCESLKGRVALLGGGVGIPPLCHTAKTLQQQGVTVDAYLGYRDELFAVEDFESWCTDMFISTEHGDEGYKGFITDLLKPERYDAVLTCGPEVMMRKVAAMCAEKGVACYCSLEHRMACGIGICLVCVCKIKAEEEGIPFEHKRCCKDGPVFDSKEVIW